MRWDLKKELRSSLQVIILLAIISINIVNADAAASQGTSVQKPKLEWSLYSESTYDDRINGSVTDTRLRIKKPFFKNTIYPFVSVSYSQDLTNGSAPQFIQNALTPSYGLLFKLPNKWNFLQVLTEKRYHFLTNKNQMVNEFKYGLTYYWIKNVSNQLNVETYGEYIGIDRVSNKLVFSSWARIFKQAYNKKNIQLLYYSELFTRQSPDINYGPTENELRIGLKSNFLFPPFGISAQLNQSLLSNTKPGGIDFLLAIYGGTF